MTDEVADLPTGHPPIVFDRDSGVDVTTYSDVEDMLRSRSFGMEGTYQDPHCNRRTCTPESPQGHGANAQPEDAMGR
jgi:hypothetical protein